MLSISKYTVRKILMVMGWTILCSGIIVLLIAAMTRRNNERCSKIEVNITGVQNNFFVDKKEVLDILKKANGGRLETKPLHSIDLASIETALQKTAWIKKAELFFDNNNVLVVKITESEPIARIFTSSGLSFYLDTSLSRLPLSDKFSARLPVFTNFPSDVKILSKRDKDLIKDIRVLGEFVVANPFWMAQIDQIDITPDRTFDLIPKLGTQVIHFGNAENYQEKFNNLLCFYKQVLSKKGWNKYSALSLEFKGQVVGIKRGAEEIKTDSLRSVQIMKAIISEAQKHAANDFTNIQLEQPEDNNNSVNSSKEIEIIPDEDVKNNTNDKSKTSGSLTPIHVPEKPISDQQIPKRNRLISKPSSSEKPNADPAKKQVIKPAGSLPAVKIKEKPKAVMPPKSDY